MTITNLIPEQTYRVNVVVFDVKGYSGPAGQAECNTLQRMQDRCEGARGKGEEGRRGKEVREGSEDGRREEEIRLMTLCSRLSSLRQLACRPIYIRG